MDRPPMIPGTEMTGVFPRIYDREYLDVASGDGIWLTDANGNEYMDVASGNQNVNIGHGRTEIADAAYEQLTELEYVPMYYTTESVREFGKEARKFMPDGFEDTWLVSGGSLAIESALTMARQYHLETGNPQKRKFITRRGSWHGTTVGALSATGYEPYRAYMDPLLLDFPKAPKGNRYRCDRCGGGGGRDCGIECAEAVEQLIQEEGPENIAAFMAEPVGGGFSPGERPHPGYLERVREICDEHDVLFVMDEVLTGLGRTGTNLASEHYDFDPDIILTGKGLTAGYAPAGALTPHERVAEAFHGVPEGFTYGHTNTMNPVTAAVGRAVLEYIRREQLVDNAAQVGEHLGERLQDLEDYDAVGDVRGVGLLHGVEFVADPETGEPFDTETGMGFRQILYQTGMEYGLMLATEGGHLEGYRGDFMTIAPPLTIDESTADELVDRTYQAVGDALDRAGLR